MSAETPSSMPDMPSPFDGEPNILVDHVIPFINDLHFLVSYFKGCLRERWEDAVEKGKEAPELKKQKMYIDPRRIPGPSFRRNTM